MADEVFGISMYRLILAFPVILLCCRFGFALVLPKYFAKLAFRGMLLVMIALILVTVGLGLYL